MEMRLSGRATESRVLHPWKALLPMVVRPSGKEADAKEVAP